MLVAVDALERTRELVVVVHLEIAELNFADVVRFHSYSEKYCLWGDCFFLSLAGHC